MKKILLIIVVLIPTLLFAQKKGKDVKDVKYRRSSLHIMLIEDNDLDPQYKGIIVDAMLNAPWPDKYDQHDIGIASYDILSIDVPKAKEEEEAEKSKEEENENSKEEK